MAREELTRAHAAITERAGVRHMQDAGSAIQGVFSRHPATLEDALAAYRARIDAAARFVAGRKLVPIPELALDLAPLPPGIADGTGVTNWPAPLLDPEGRGHVLYAPYAAAHPSVAIKNLAVHEAIPGHYLQSVTWQRALASADRSAPPSAVRWLSITDDVAMSRAVFGAMVSVKGWAVHMEQLLREHGFYDAGDESLFFALCDAIRAVRVILDIELSAGAITSDAAIRLVVDATSMPEAWARRQVLRAKRMPLQGLTYLVGARAIADLRSRAKAISPERFHRALLAKGPVPPSRLTEADLGAA